MQQFEGEAAREQHPVPAGGDAQYPQKCRVDEVELHQYQQVVELEVAGEKQMNEVARAGDAIGDQPGPGRNCDGNEPIGRLSSKK